MVFIILQASCGFKPTFSSKDVNFAISKIEVKDKSNISRKIKNNLKIYKNVKNPNNIFAAACVSRGLFAGGFMPNTVKAAPPLTISEEEINFAVDVMDKAFSEVEKIYQSNNFNIYFLQGNIR